MKRPIAKLFVLVGTSILGMALLGVAAFIAAVYRDGLWGPRRLLEWVVLAYPAAVGAFLGFFSLPFVVAFLKNASLIRSLPRIYGVSLIINVVWATLIPVGLGVTTAVPAMLSVILMSRWCAERYALPEESGCCPRCDYDISGCRIPGCPECGWGRGA